ncbi:MAG: hypothetical protein GKR94_20120 [Gammaproteobacteria bacterium]|nr:hypothetical protein [Gammaproteobacteria bacterium]
MAIILGGDGGWPWPRNAGDWMAVIAGALWACGTFIMYRGVKLAAFEQVLALAAGGALCALLLAYGVQLQGPRLLPVVRFAAHGLDRGEAGRGGISDSALSTRCPIDKGCGHVPSCCECCSRIARSGSRGCLASWRALTTDVRRRAGYRRRDAQTGVVTCIQRFG